MPFNGSGTFTPASPSYPAVAGTVIQAADRNTLDEDFASGLSNCITRDGQSPPTADIDWGGRKLTGLGDAVADGQALNWGQIFDSAAPPTLPGGTQVNGTFRAAGRSAFGSPTPASNMSVRAGGFTGATTYIGFNGDDEIKSDVTSSFYGYRSSPTTQAAAFTLATLQHFAVLPGAFGADSSVTEQIGFRVGSGMTGGTSNYGFVSELASGTGRWNFYASGTAANHFRGETTFGAKFGYGTTAGVGGTVTQATSKTTAVTLNTLSGEITMNAAALAADSSAAFQFNNTHMDINDQLIVTHQSAGSLGGYLINTRCNVGAGIISVRNVTAGSLAEAIVLRFTLIKGASA